jgi:hypothetical protein
MLGQPLMPWQQHVMDVALEVDPSTGLLAYRSYVVIVGRQNGKTTMVRSKLAHRALGFGRPQSSIYTAQTADKAREKWRYDQVEVFQASPLNEMIADVTLRLNNERLTWKNGSWHKPVTPSQKTGGTGDSIDEPVVDEAWAIDASLESAMRPTMSTREQPQFGIVSTGKRQPKGEHSSRFASWLRGKQREGRARCEAGIDSNIAFFDYSAPRDMDPGDPATWWSCLPALGHMQQERAIAADFDNGMELGDFCAEYLGWWEDESALQWQVIPQQRWAEVADRDLKPGYPMAFAIDTNPDRGTSIGSAGPALAGQRMCVEVVEHRPGTGWVVARAVQLVERWRPCAVVINPASGTNSLIKPLKIALELAKLDPDVVKTPTLREVSAGFGLFLDAVTDPRSPQPLRHANQIELDTAAAIGQKRKVGQGMWSWDWTAPGDVSPLVAVTNALWAATVYGPAHQAADYDIMKSFY